MNTQLAIQKFLHNRRAQNLKLKSIEWYEAELRRFAWVGEIAGLGKQDVKDNYIKVRGKRGERGIPISGETRHLLLAVIVADGKSELVLTGSQGEGLSRFIIYRLIRKVMKKASIEGPKFGPHRIRHAFEKGYLANGGDVCSPQQIMGHAIKIKEGGCVSLIVKVEPFSC